jgi:hypothetical protein
MFGIIGKWNNPDCAQGFWRVIEAYENGTERLLLPRPLKALQAKQQKHDGNNQSGNCIHLHADSHAQKLFASANKLI